ncbi:hypothetical protein Cni_G21827 [Canna indica]|uniref:Uncharacterized protein n=1 Tax=Canna indica TaxID=4628 RepID=A0AAQ3KTV9_9LILI|nr:hypothetical protein Cni_G21827 [Canna indica]
MGIRMAAVFRVKQMLQQSLRSHHHHHHHHNSAVAASNSSSSSDVPKGHFAVYVGEMEKRFVVPISYLQHPLFQNLLHKAEEEYGFHSPGGMLRVPCNEDAFAVLTSQMNTS